MLMISQRSARLFSSAHEPLPLLAGSGALCCSAARSQTCEGNTTRFLTGAECWPPAPLCFCLATLCCVRLPVLVAARRGEILLERALGALAVTDSKRDGQPAACNAIRFRRIGPLTCCNAQVESRVRSLQLPMAKVVDKAEAKLQEAKPAAKSVWQNIKPFFNGGASGMLATCVIQPIDMVKVRLQLGAQGSPVRGLYERLPSGWASHGEIRL